MARKPNPFDWSGGHPALDLVNTLDERPSGEPIENLIAYSDFVNFTELAGLLTPSTAKELRAMGGPACVRVARRARELRENLYAVLAAINEGQCIPRVSLDVIDAEIRRAHTARTLTPTGSTIGHGWVSPSAPEVPLHACALAAEALLVSTDHSRIRKCGAADCAVYFIDTSKAHRRQWCSMQNCGNREKQRRWRST